MTTVRRFSGVDERCMLMWEQSKHNCFRCAGKCAGYPLTLVSSWKFLTNLTCNFGQVHMDRSFFAPLEGNQQHWKAAATLEGTNQRWRVARTFSPTNSWVSPVSLKCCGLVGTTLDDGTYETGLSVWGGLQRCRLAHQHRWAVGGSFCWSRHTEWFVKSLAS